MSSAARSPSNSFARATLAGIRLQHADKLLLPHAQLEPLAEASPAAIRAMCSVRSTRTPAKHSSAAAIQYGQLAIQFEAAQTLTLLWSRFEFPARLCAARRQCRSVPYSIAAANFDSSAFTCDERRALRSHRASSTCALSAPYPLDPPPRARVCHRAPPTSRSMRRHSVYQLVARAGVSRNDPSRCATSPRL
jgi:hypothetical protein